MPGASTNSVSMAGYKDVKLIPFVMAIGVVSLPIVYLKTTGQNEWVWKYILLITLTLVIYYQEGITRFAGYMATLQKQI